MNELADNIGEQLTKSITGYELYSNIFYSVFKD